MNIANAENPKQLLEQSELIHSARAVEAAIEHLASQIGESMGNSSPVVMCVMGGAVVFSGTRAVFSMASP